MSHFEPNIAVMASVLFGRKPGGAGFGFQVGIQRGAGVSLFEIGPLVALRGITLGYAIAFDEQGIGSNRVSFLYSFSTPSRLRPSLTPE